MRRILVLLLLLTLVTPGCNRASRGAPAGAEACSCDGMYVQSITPTNGQVVLPDLSDAGLNGRLTMKLSLTPRRSDWLDSTRVPGAPAPRVRVERHDGARVAGAWSIDEATRSVIFSPEGDLSPGQYTVTIETR